jgi:hypothetical protein
VEEEVFSHHARGLKEAMRIRRSVEMRVSTEKGANVFIEEGARARLEPVS